MRKKLVALTLATTLVAGMLTGCSSKAGGETGENAIIRIAQSADIVSFDPHKHNDTASGTATRHLYNTLIGLTSENTFVGELAESWEYLDDKTVAFKLREGVKFHNGDMMTAEDVKFSLERQKESSRVGHLVAMIDNVEVKDANNFIIHMSEPSAALISSLAHMGGAVLSKKHVEELEAAGKTIDDDPVGTGPYKFVSWKPGDSYELARFDEYYGEKAKNGGLVVRVMPEEASRTIALETGEVDLVINVGAVDANRVRENKDLELVEYQSTQIELFVMNTEKAPFDNKLVRQAVNHAIDGNAVLKVAVKGEAEPITGYIAPAAIGYADVNAAYEYNIEKAKALLTEAGYPDGFEIKVYLAGDTRSRSAQVIQEALGQIGITMKIEMMESGTFYDKTGAGEHDACLTGWVANAEPDNTFNPLFHSDNRGQGGNRAFYSNPEVDKLIDQAKVTIDPTERQNLYAEVQKIITGDAIYAPLYNVKGMVAKRANLKGLVVYPISTHRYDGLYFE